MTRALGLDFGLSGVRTAVVDDQEGVIATGRAGDPVRIEGGRAEYDPESAWLSMCAAIDQLGEAADTVDVIGIGALGPTPFLVDSFATPLTPGLCFSFDTRANDERRAIDPMLSHDHALAKVLWLNERRPGAAFAVDMASWVGWRLTGEPKMDAITRLQYVHAGTECPLPLPPSIDPLAVIGPLTADIGVPTGIPVVAGTLDSYVDVVAAGCTRVGDGCVILGSTLIIYGVVPVPVAVPGLELQPYPGDGYLLGGSTANGGNVLAWAHSLLGTDVAADASGVEMLPYLTGERTPVRTVDAQGAITGLSLTTTGPQIVRAVVDALGLATLDHSDLIESVAHIDRWIVTGGGVQSDAWLQVTADALGQPLEVAPLAGGGSGPALFALHALGVVPSFPATRTVEPDLASTERLRAALGSYRDKTRSVEAAP